MLQPKFRLPAPITAIILMVLYSVFNSLSVMIAAGLAWVLFEVAIAKLLNQSFRFVHKSILEQTPDTFPRYGATGMALPIRPSDFTVACVNNTLKTWPGGLIPYPQRS